MSCETCNLCDAKARAEMFNKTKIKYAEISSFVYDYKTYSHPLNMLLGVTNRCNLACEYCFVQQNSQDMTLETAEKAIQWLFENKKIQNSDEKLNVNFFGGEPLLKFNDIIKPIIEKYHDNIVFGITTNGILLDEDAVDFFNQYKVNILLSFDGVPEVQNKQRSNSFDAVLENIPYLLIRFPETVMRSTITKDSIPYLYESTLMAEELGFKKIVFCPNQFENWGEKEYNALYEQFKKIGAYIYEGLIKNTEPIKVDPLNSYYLKTVSAVNQDLYFNNRLLRCGLGTVTCAIAPNGDIIPCQEKISCPTTVLGNVYKDGIEEEVHKTFLMDYFEKINSITCNKGCSEKVRLNCLSDICPSRMEDLNYKFSTPGCIFTKVATQVANRLHLLCHASPYNHIRVYFEGEKEAL